ncbi:MAG: cyclic nucleotide-binding domain-containing protein [Myxococcales bacterium]
MTTAIEKSREAKEKGSQLLAKGKLDAALKEFQRAVEVFPEDLAAQKKVAEVLARLGKKRESIAGYQRLAGFYAADGQLAQAIAISKLILQLDPAHTQTQDTIAKLYARKSGGSGGTWLEKIPSSMAGALNTRHVKAVEPPQPAPIRPPAPPSPEPAAEAKPVFTELEPELAVDVQIDTSALPKQPLFSELPKEIFLALLAELEISTVDAGTPIVTEGEPGRSMYVLAQGTVKVVRELGTRQEKTVATMTEGTFFGEIALLSDAPRLASVVAQDECVVLEIKRELLGDLVMKHDALEPVLQHFYRERLLENLLRSSPLFAAFGPDERHALIDKFAVRRAKKGELLVHEGAAGAALFVLLRGCCDVFHVDAKGHEHTYPPLSEGALFGEITLMQEGATSASVRAADDCLLLEARPRDVPAAGAHQRRGQEGPGRPSRRAPEAHGRPALEARRRLRRLGVRRS